MRFLLTNDDGYDAHGIGILEKLLTPFGKVIVVAPAHAHSGCSHRTTTDEPIRVESRAEGFIVHGTPVDCTRLGLTHLATDVDWVFSGINHGGNLGADVYISGTLAAVREGALHGVPGVGLSHYRAKGRPFDWKRAERVLPGLIEELLNRPLEAGAFWNVNLPHPPDAADDPTWEYCPLDPNPLPVTYRIDGELYRYNGEYHGRARWPGHDVDVCFSGKLAVTKLSLGGDVPEGYSHPLHRRTPFTR